MSGFKDRLRPSRPENVLNKPGVITRLLRTRKPDVNLSP